MKKILFTILVLVSLVGLTNAQDKMSLGAGLVISLPMGDFGDAANTGFGGTAAFEMSFSPNITGVGNIGYLYWGTDVEDINWTAVPVMVGVKYYFTPGMGFYGLGQVGLTFFSIDIPSYEFFGVTYGGGSETSTEFSLALGAGYEVPLSSNMKLDLTGAFNLISDANHITLRVGVLYDL